MARSRKFLISLVVCALVAGVAYVVIDGQEPAAGGTATETAERPLELSPVEVARVESQTIAADLRITGTLRPARRTIIAAQVSGTIEDVAVKIGQSVEQDDVLLQFDLVPLESTLAARRASRDAMQAQLRQAQAVLARSARLGLSGISSEAARLEAEANVANLEAQLRGLDAEVADAERNLSDGTVRAPFAGVISERRIEPGQTVAINTELLSMVDLDIIEVEAGVPAGSVAEVRPGQIARLSINGLPARTFDARVVRIAPTAAEGSRTVRVYLELPNEDGLLRGGMFATGTLDTGSRSNVIALPDTALRRDEAGEFVLKAVDGRLVRQAVTVDPVPPRQGLLAFTEGLTPGDTVVVAPLPALKADTAIEIGA